MCSHRRAYLYYAKSVYLKEFGLEVVKTFPAVHCKKNLFNQLECSDEVTYMGYDVDKDAPEGDYYLLTSFGDVEDLYGAIPNWNLDIEGSDPFFNKTVAFPADYGFL